MITCRLINGVVARFTIILADESQEAESVGYVDRLKDGVIADPH